ncbi:hypothetical protein [Flavivirga jejuensis]|uniref:Lipoprotein n=1 Tax=Flavivirga jejuensis TaxID=870487 RepID=A0ABT8WPV9_9FLAO|nr:hypothetical protein [Flavivirga jejuensis]MDO5975024.1 hypothetical protein [Flavivirga jejuensis]
MRVVYVLIIALLLICCKDDKQIVVYSKMEKSFINDEYKNVWNLNPVFSFEQAQKLSKSNKKDILVVFTGINNSGTPKMIWEILNNRDVSNTINNNFVFCILFTDVPYNLRKSDTISIKKKNLQLRKTLSKTTSANSFIKVNPSGEKVSKELILVSKKQKRDLLIFLTENK